MRDPSGKLAQRLELLSLGSLLLESIAIRKQHDRPRTNRDLVAEPQWMGSDSLTVDEGAIAAPEVLDGVAVFPPPDAGMAPRHTVIENLDRAVGAPAKFELGLDDVAPPGRVSHQHDELSIFDIA